MPECRHRASKHSLSHTQAQYAQTKAAVKVKPDESSQKAVEAST